MLRSVLDDLMRRGWPSLEESTVDGWLARFAEGVTQRANSVLPLAEPSAVHRALSAVESLYAARGLPAVFQLGPVTHPPDLDALLAARGYRYGSPTLVRTAPVAAVLALPVPSVTVTISDEPDEEWMALWWQVDGRGDDTAKSVARKILTGGPARYATTRGSAGATAVARLALVDTWGGLYCLAVRPDARRGRLAAAVTRALVADAASDGVEHCWLQVREENTAARALYTAAGFTTVARYHYRTQPTA
jgi:N-acetylglutamate synthase